jgi:hypothetical protein
MEQETVVVVVGVVVVMVIVEDVVELEYVQDVEVVAG